MRRFILFRNLSTASETPKYQAYRTEKVPKTLNQQKRPAGRQGASDYKRSRSERHTGDVLAFAEIGDLVGRSCHKRAAFIDAVYRDDADAAAFADDAGLSEQHFPGTRAQKMDIAALRIWSPNA